MPAQGLTYFSALRDANSAQINNLNPRFTHPADPDLQIKFFFSLDLAQAILAAHFDTR